MKQCANDYGKEYPEAANVIHNCFYIDDGLFGEDNIATLKMRCKEVEYVLKQGGFELSKWASNSVATEKYMQGDMIDNIELGNSENESKILGLRWMKPTDEIAIVVKQPTSKTTDTKRKILSEIAKLFDSNGYVAPIIVVAKLLMRDIWAIKHLTWDKAVPQHIGKRWMEFVNELSRLNEYHIPRWLSTDKQSTVQLHGFCDASTKAMGAVIYVRVCKNDAVTCTLLAAKSKVSSEKGMSIPRMELLAALLGSKLMCQAAKACEYESVEKFLWSDSAVALYWIKRSPLELKTFVANRVEAIQQNTEGNIWSHVTTTENPADLVSRGMKTEDFVRSDFCKQGPSWLGKHQNEWPKPIVSITPEQKNEISKETKKKVNQVLSVMVLNTSNQVRELWYRSND